MPLLLMRILLKPLMFLLLMPLVRFHPPLHCCFLAAPLPQKFIGQQTRCPPQKVVPPSSTPVQMSMRPQELQERQPLQRQLLQGIRW